MTRESIFDGGVAAVAGLSAWWCLALLGVGPAALAAGAAAFALVLLTMKRLAQAPRRYQESIVAPLPSFEDELLLENAEEDDGILEFDIVAPQPVAEAQERIASAFDALLPRGAPVAEHADGDGHDSRVVALFGGERSPPSAGELKARIDAHLAQGGAEPLAPLPPDASEALSAALRSLRRPE